MPKALICGAGKIGRGFIAHLLSRSDYAIYFLDVAPGLIDALNTHKSYPVYLAGKDGSEQVHLEQAFLPEDAGLAGLCEELDVMVSCVGARHIQATVETLLPLLQARQSQTAINWFICENADRPAALIKKTLCDGQSAAWQARVDNEIGLIETQVLRSGMCVDTALAQDEPLAVKMQDWWTLPADADAVKGARPVIEGLVWKHQFENELQRKLYTFNGLNGPIAYMGALHGHQLMDQAATDPQLQSFYDEIQAESAHGLINEYGFDSEEHAAFQAVARKKYADPALADSVDRNAQDTARKLGMRERLLGPALLCFKHGREPVAYAQAIAAALQYEAAADDVGSQAVQDSLRDLGLAATVQHFAGIAADHPLIGLIINAYEQQCSHTNGNKDKQRKAMPCI